MKYIIRVIKYFVYISLIMTLILVVLAAAGFISKDINVIFRDGYRSLWKIGAMFLAVAAVYPRFGFTKRGAIILGEYKDIRDGIVEFMKDRNYVLEKEEGENLYFRQKSALNRATRMFEDRISLTRDMSGFYVEGLTKDVTRLVYGLEYKFKEGEGEEENQ